MRNRLLAFYQDPGGGPWRRIFFVALAALLFVLSVVVTLLDSSEDIWPDLIWAFVMCAALAFTGYFPATGGTIFVVFASFAAAFSVDVSLCMYGLYVVAADWISRRWYLFAALALLIGDGMSFIRSDLPPFVFYEIGLGYFFAISVGLTMQWQKKRIAKLEYQAVLNERSRRSAEKKIQTELAAALHDTVVRNLVRLHVTSQSLVGSGLAEEDARLIDSLVTDTIRSVRSLMVQVRPTVFYESLQQVIDTCQTMLDMRNIHLRSELPPDADKILTRNQQAVLTLTMLEGSTNILKHAPPDSKATLVLEILPGECITLTMTNLISNTAEEADGLLSGGFGLTNLSSRIDRDGGRLYHWIREDVWVLTAELPTSPVASRVLDQELEPEVDQVEQVEQ